MNTSNTLSAVGYGIAWMGGIFAILGIPMLVFPRIIATWLYGSYFGMADIGIMLSGIGSMIMGAVVWGIGVLLWKRSYLSC